MKQYLTEFDELQAALRKVRIDENVMPYHMGRLVEDEDSYNKIQKLLDCPQMASSHRYLYELDVENLQEGEIDKINQLFDLGVKKGYIDNSFEEEFQKEENPDAVIADEPESCPACKSAADVRQQFSAPVPCWTILYSATKGGEIKSGECYSNAVSVSAAKADCLAKLAKFGYENVSVLAIEAGDPDMCGADDVNECKVKENDMLKNRPHNGHKSVSESDDEVEEGEDEQIEEAGKNPYVAGMKVVTGGKVSTAKPAAKKTKKLKEDDEGADDEGADDSEGGEDEGSEDAGAEGSEDAGAEGSEDAEDTEGDAEDEDTDGGEELDDSKKAQYKNEYRRIFQEVMAACKFGGKSFNDLTIDEKVKFFTKLKERWMKADPKEFMSDKEQDQLESITIEGGDEGSDNAEGDDAEGSENEGSETEDEGSDDTEGEDTESSEDEGSDAGGDEADGEDEGSEDEGSDDTEDEDTEDEDTEGEDTEGEDTEGEDTEGEDTEGEE